MTSSKQRKTEFKTASGLTVNDLYTQADLPDNLGSELGEPGQFPFTRGVYPNMYRGRLWTMRQYAGYGTAAEANQRYQYLLKQGTTGLSVAFDLPTQMGRDSDHSLARGEVGKVGVAISSLDDMRVLLKDIPLEKVSISMTINATAAILLSLLLVIAEERKISWEKLRGTIQNDILKEYIARGTYIYPPRPALRLVTDIFSFCAKNVPNWNTISISGYHMREAGSTAVEEIAFTLANGICYVDAALKAGLKIDDFGPQLAFFFNCHSDFFEEVAKFRAARRMWAKIMRERFGSKDSASQMLRFHTQTAGSSLTAQQPFNNVVRTTLQALAAALGGTQSLHTNSYDEALCLPSEESATLALRTQQVIAHESGVADVVDPLAGSYFVENLTNSLEQEAWKRIKYIDQLGGMLPAIEQGYPQAEIEKSAYKWQREIENKERIVVGVNSFNLSEKESVAIQHMDPQGEAEQLKALKKFKTQRNIAAAESSIRDLESASKGSDNLIPYIVEAIRKQATLGEISDVLRSAFGEYKPSSTLSI